MDSKTVRSVSLKTPLEDDVLFIKRLTGTEELGRPFCYEVEFLSNEAHIDFDELVGQKITVLLSIQHHKFRYFNGYISCFRQLERDEGHFRYQAKVVPWISLLTQSSDCRILQDKTVPEILKDVFKAHGFDKYEMRLSRTYRKLEYCVQYRETDFNFVSRLMEQEGIYYFFIHDEDDHTLVIVDSPVAHQSYDPDYENILYRPASDEVSESEDIQSWTLQKELRPTSFAHTDFDFQNPRKNLLSQSQIPREHAASDFQFYDYPGNFTNHDEGEEYAKIRIEELQTQHQIFQGKSNARGLAAGFTFTLEDCYREDQNLNYLIWKIHHTITSDAFRAKTIDSDSPPAPVYQGTFSAIVSDTPFRPAQSTLRPSISGLQTAIVVGTESEEIYTDKFGRIKVQFHWDRDGQFKEDSSCWVRVSQYWAGKNSGALFLPRVGQEVIVEFVNGNPDHPVITGQLYNGESMPPYTLPGEKTQSGMRSRSSKGGSPEHYSEIRFEDKKGEEQLIIHSERDLNISVENDRKEEVGHDEKRSVENDREHDIKHDEKLIVGNNRTLTVEGTHTETIKKDTKINITEGKYEHDVAGNSAKYHVKNDLEEDYDGKQTTKVANEIAITSEEASIHITAKTEIQLSVGSSKLLMKSDGSIELSGNNIAIKGLETVQVKGGSITSQADTDNNVKGNNVLSEGAVVNTVKGGMLLLNP